jgi:DNA-binding beta-propeller fold protein YncE
MTTQKTGFNLATSMNSRRTLYMTVAMFVFAGCEPIDPANPPPLDPSLVFGVAGPSMGQFDYPRALATDVQRQLLYVIDKTSRVQRFGFDGVPQMQWTMPAKENGKPTGVSVSPDGRIFVADTHYFRVIAYDADGNELLRFGEYGTKPGQFIYLTDIAFGPEGKLYVSEYGGNDRVQVFSPQGEPLFSFGTFGSRAGQFIRPQALVFNAAKSELYIADACNHRIVVVDPNGTFIRSFGKAGQGVGELSYPYSVELMNDGTLLVAEFGNNRVQQFDREGHSIGLFGRLGRDKGELQYPWAVAAADDSVFVLDSGNNRVQVIRTP